MIKDYVWLRRDPKTIGLLREILGLPDRITDFEVGLSLNEPLTVTVRLALTRSQLRELVELVIFDEEMSTDGVQ